MSHAPEYHKDNHCERRFQEEGPCTEYPEPCPVCYPLAERADKERYDMPIGQLATLVGHLQMALKTRMCCAMSGATIHRVTDTAYGRAWKGTLKNGTTFWAEDSPFGYQTVLETGEGEVVECLGSGTFREDDSVLARAIVLSGKAPAPWKKST